MRPAAAHDVMSLPKSRVDWTKSEVARLDADLLGRMREKMQLVEPRALPPAQDLESFIANLTMDFAAEFGGRHDLTPDECSILVSAVLGIDDMEHFKELEVANAPKLVKALFKRFDVDTLPKLGLLVLQEALAGRWWEAHQHCAAKPTKGKGKKR